METKFSPNLLDNDPNFEHQPNKIIKVNSAAWFDWLAANDSFRFNAGDNSYRARKEYNIPAKTDYWYAVKKVGGKLHKKFIGKTEQLTHARLIEISRVIMQPPQPRKTVTKETITTPQETSNPDLVELIQSLSLRLDNLEKKQTVETAEVIDVKSFEDAIASLKDELANKDMQLSRLTNELTNANSKLTELTNELSNANSKPSEGTNQLDNSDNKPSEGTNQLDNSDMQLSEGTNELDNDLDNSDMQLSEGTNELDNDLNKSKLINLLGLEDILSGDLYNADSLKKEGYFKAMADNKAKIAEISGIEAKLSEDLTDMNAIIKWLGYKSIRTTQKNVSYRRVTGKIEP